MEETDFEKEFEESLASSDESGFLDAPLGTDVLTNKDFQRFGYRFSLDDLNSDFSKKVQIVLSACQARGVIMIPYTGIRTPWEQARLWRQSRTTATVNAAIERLRADSAGFLADVLRDVGPQTSGTKVTGALPGYSWHQWGESVDSYWQVNGKPEWDDLTGYKVYAEEGEKSGLTAGGYWTSLQDWPHLQLRKTSNPGRLYTAKEINKKMLDDFGATQRAIQGLA